MTTQSFEEIATRHQAHLERLKTHESASFTKYLTKILKDVRAQLNADGNITEFSRQRLRALEAQIKLTLKEKLADFKVDYDKTLLEIAEYESEFEKKSLEKVVKTDFNVPSSTQLQSAVFTNPLTVAGIDGGSLVSEYYRDLSAREIKRTSKIIMAGYAEGLTNQQIYKNMRDNGFSRLDHHMRTLVRTTVQHASSQARKATWKANEDIIDGVKWVSTLDSKTSDTCQALDGMVFSVDEGKLPPAHYNCRSTTVPVLDKRFAILEQGMERAARDPVTGEVTSVPAKQTYFSWLKGQPADVQDSIIGSDLGKRIRKGEIDHKKFVELKLGSNFKAVDKRRFKELEGVALTGKKTVKDDRKTFSDSLLNSNSDEYEAFYSWSAGSHSIMRTAFRNGELKYSKSELRDNYDLSYVVKIENMDKIFKTYKPNNIKDSYRGLSFDKKQKVDLERYNSYKSLNIGDRYIDVEPASYSKMGLVAESFAEIDSKSTKSVILRYKNAKGYDMGKTSQYDVEEEVLMPFVNATVKDIKETDKYLMITIGD